MDFYVGSLTILKGWLRTDRDEKDEYPVWGDFIIFSLCQSRISRIKTFQMNSDIAFKTN